MINVFWGGFWNHLPLSCSKPVTWAPHWSCRGLSGVQGRWCWTWRWSPWTTSSTSEGAPSYGWRYLSQRTRSESPHSELCCLETDQEESMVLSRQLKFICLFPLFPPETIMSSSMKTHPIKTQPSSADGKASLGLNPHPCLMDTELLRLRWGLWTHRDVYGVQFLTSSI